MADHSVVVAGAGPTGLMLAGELALAGVDVVVLERRPNQQLSGARALGITSRTEVRWLVFAIGKIAPRAIAGNYAGVSASASAGAGLGANVLVGGRNNSVSLQPVSVQAQTGLNIAIGISGLNLRYLGR